MATSSAGDLDWLLDDLVTRVPDVDKAVILSRDGLAIAASSALTREDAEHLAAIAAGFQSLARGAAGTSAAVMCGRPSSRWTTAFLFVTAAGEGSCLAVLSPASADVGLVAYEMAVLVKRVGQHLCGQSPADHGRGDRGLSRMPSPEDQWLDEEAGPVVRPYALIRGRTRPSGEVLDLIAIITAIRGVRPDPSDWARSTCAVLRMCRLPTSVADLAADLDLPLGVVRILLGDLAGPGPHRDSSPDSARAAA